MEHDSSPLLPLFFHAVNFSILIGLFIYAYVKKGKPAIRSFLDQAESDIRRAAERLKQAELDLEKARTEREQLGARIMELDASNRQEIQRGKGRILEGARLSADYMVKEADQHSALMVRRATGETVREVVESVLGRTKTELGTKMTAETHERIERRFASTLSEGKDFKWTS